MSLALEDDIEEAAQRHATEIFERVREIARAHGTEVSTDVAWGSPAREIIGRADSFDTVVIGSHGGSMADRLFVGNVAQTVFRRSPVPVTVVR
jgi:nucleotide-binding universal stress UspA family protein